MYLRVEVVPGSRKEDVAEGKNGSLILRVKEPAEGNRANERVREIIAERFTLPIGKVRILTGHHSRTKMLTIDNDE